MSIFNYIPEVPAKTVQKTISKSLKKDLKVIGELLVCEQNNFQDFRSFLLHGALRDQVTAIKSDCLDIADIRDELPHRL